MQQRAVARGLSRRRILAAGSAVLAMPYVSRAHAAGKLSIGLWDHWVPGANDVSTKVIKEWGEKEKVDVSIDYITSQGNKLLLTIAAEAQAHSGHDIIEFTNWECVQHAEPLEPVDDVFKQVVAANGPMEPALEYLTTHNGKRIGIPMTRGTLLLSVCSRYDLLKQHAGIDIRAIYPAGQPAKPEGWTYDAFLKAAEACSKAGVPFGIPMGVTTDTVLWIGGLFKAFGAEFMDANRKITVKSDAMRQAIDFGKRLMAFLPPDVPAWDDASNNKWLISGKGALIMNPPSAWAVAKRDAPAIAEKCWTHGFPAGPKGRFNPMLPRIYGLWSFSQNKSAAKSLLLHLSSRAAAERLVAAGQGYDIPPYPSFHNFKTWETEGPPPGTLYHYPNRGDQQIGICYSPTPPLIAAQIWAQALAPKMIVRHFQGEAMESVLNWGASEVEGFLR